MFNELFSRSFSKNEQKKLSMWAFLACVVMALSFCAVLKSYMGPLPLLNLQLASTLNLKVFSIIDKRDNNEIRSSTNTTTPPPIQVRNYKPMCNFSLPRSDFCEINGDVRIHGNSSTIFISPSLFDDKESSHNNTWKLKPYARKQDHSVQKWVRELSMGSPSSFGFVDMPECSINHTVPAIVFSTGGYAGNHFHEFSDILVPLYITSRPFNGEVQFVVTDIKPWWLIKHRAFLNALSNYTILDMDNSREVHCFPGMVAGLKSEFEIEPSQSPQGYSMRSFAQFVRSAYSLKRSKVEPLMAGEGRKPRLLIISRKGSRALVNEDEVVTEARRLGYEVVSVDARKNLKDFSKMVNSFDVMVGVHGAGLTNSFFLPENAILIQVVPLRLEWVSKHAFELPALAMNLRYLGYKISWNESSLAEKYSLEDPIIRDPGTLKGWPAFKKVYLDGQNVRIDMGRFRNTLLKALELLQQ